MIDKNKRIKVINKYNGIVGYEVPDLNVHRIFYPTEDKEISFDELERLSFVPGGEVILRDYLEIADEEAVVELFNQKSEPEYHYSKEDVKNLLINGSLDQFLDCLDFAPESIKELIKDIAVNLPLNDMEKRDAIQEKLGFNVTKAIEIKNTKFDGGDDDTESSEQTGSKRRTAPIKSNAAPSGRRYKPVTKEEIE